MHLDLKVLQFLRRMVLGNDGKWRYSTISLREVQKEPEGPILALAPPWVVLGGPAGGTGVGQHAGLLLVLGRAVGLQRRHGSRGVLAPGGAAFAAEQLALDFPEVVAVVKPGEGENMETVKYRFL